MNPVSFKNTNTQFCNELKKEIDHYFSSKQLKKTGNYQLIIKSIFFLLTAVASYMTLIFFPLPGWGAVIFCLLLGLSFAGIGFNVMHDAGHGSYSNKGWLNELMSYSLNLMGGNIFMWKNKHNVNHHTYTNIDGIDEDIDIQPLLRTHANQPKRWFHRYQHLYALGLYSLTYLNWIFIGDFKKYIFRKIGNTDLKNMNFKEHVIFWMSKALYFLLFIVFPIKEFGLIKFLIGYSLCSVACGLTLGIVFQLAHLVEDATFPLPCEDSNKIEQHWILHQIATTINFGTKSKFTFWFTGGLNFQVVHHLFPKVSHIHYPKMNEIIRETCRKYEIKYNESPSFWSALRSHLSHLKKLGAKCNEVSPQRTFWVSKE